MSARIAIFQRGGQKNHEVLERAARFFIAARMSARMANTIELRIEVRATKLEEGVLAKAMLPTNGSKPSRSFTVVLDRERPLILQIEDLAHELVHVEQAASGRLQYRRWRTDGKTHVRWEGVEMGPVGCIPYPTRPWEVEARTGEKELAFAFFRSDRDARTACGVQQ